MCLALVLVVLPAPVLVPVLLGVWAEAPSQRQQHAREGRGRRPEASWGLPAPARPRRATPPGRPAPPAKAVGAALA